MREIIAIMILNDSVAMSRADFEKSARNIESFLAIREEIAKCVISRKRRPRRSRETQWLHNNADSDTFLPGMLTAEVGSFAQIARKSIQVYLSHLEICRHENTPQNFSLLIDE